MAQALWDEAKALQRRPLPDGALRIIARGKRKDEIGLPIEAKRDPTKHKE